VCVGDGLHFAIYTGKWDYFLTAEKRRKLQHYKGKIKEVK
jgi:hypothetical protein